MRFALASGGQWLKNAPDDIKAHAIDFKRIYSSNAHRNTNRKRLLYISLGHAIWHHASDFLTTSLQPNLNLHRQTGGRERYPLMKCLD